jgi:hypothetical protein
VKPNAQNNSHAYWNICILIFLYNASRNRINVTINYIYKDPELSIISATVHMTNQPEDQYNIQHHLTCI